jgi:cytochrome P450
LSLPFVYDPSRADFQGRIYEIYRTLRDLHPVYRNPDSGVYALSRFEDVRMAASDPQRFSSEGTSIAVGLLPHIQSMDPPRHDRLRSLVTLAFTPRRVAAMEPRVREIARGLLEPLAGKGRADLMRDYARQLPSRVIGDLIGVPPERREAFLRWTESMVAVPEGRTQGESVVAPATKIYAEFARLLDERRRERRDDLISALLDAEIDGERLSQEELLGFCFVLIVAGNDTTTNLIANGAILLAEHPQARRELIAEPALIEDAIEEMLRCESPAQALPRRATRALLLHGVEIPEGAEVQLVWGAANRDEREFESPDRFDVHRRIRRHLAFGQGLHFCLGANLARLEARVAFEELLARVLDYELEEAPRFVTSVWARSPERVAIAFEA